MHRRLLAALAIVASACTQSTSTDLARASAPSAHALSADPLTHVPRLLLATSTPPEAMRNSVQQAARFHLERLAPLYGAGTSAVERASLRAVRDLGRGSITAIYEQKVDGIEVVGGAVKLLMRRNLDLVAVSGQLRPEPKSNARFALGSADAVARALAAHYGLDAAQVQTRAVATTTTGFDRVALERAPAALGATLALVQPALTARRWFPEHGQLVPAFLVEFLAARTGASSNDAFLYYIAADDGRVLRRQNLTWHEAFQYRVWADPTGEQLPFDGPQEDASPSPGQGAPEPAFVTPNLVSVEGLNHNPSGGSDSWLPPGAIETTGNNVDAFADFTQPEGFNDGDLRAGVTAAGVFDRTYDTAAAPGATPEQRMAAVTQAFYTANWVHDFLYDSGFTEATGNAQANNFGRGGLENDPLLVEAQQSSGRDNAQMIANIDGDSPRLQLFLWRGMDMSHLTVDPAGLDLHVGTAQFGKRNPFDISGTLALANDGQGVTSDACEALVGDYTGKVVLADRGICPFVTKAEMAQAAGAAGLIIDDNVEDAAPPYLPGRARQDFPINLGVLSVTLADGGTLKTAIEGGAQTVHMIRARAVDRDGAIDRSVVSHELGHLVHLRSAICTLFQCAAISEGYGDTLALLLMVKPGDDLEGAYALASYSTRSMGDSTYFGIRRFPYSTDFAKNALTFKHIQSGVALPNVPSRQNGSDNAEAHNAGEIWASTMFEVYIALVKDSLSTGRRDFYATRRVMTDYLVAGMQMLPDDASFLETRDGFLAAVAAGGDAKDLEVATQAFARRGFGSCASGPADPLDSSFSGVVESDEVRAQLVLGVPELTDAIQSCDHDGAIDQDEKGELQLTIRNASAVEATDVVVQVATEAAALSFPEGSSQTIARLAPFEGATLKFVVQAGAMTGVQRAKFTVSASADAACPNAARTVFFTVNKDEWENSSSVDDVEASTSVWIPTGSLGDLVWTRPADNDGGHHWHADELGFASDHTLLSPSVDVGDGAFRIHFRHRFNFETDAANGIYFDGAVVEISVAGMDWQNLSDFADPAELGYGGTITDQSGNVLAGQSAYVGANPSWPEYDEVVADLGSAVAGKSVQIRFRIGTDQAAGGGGWDIDDIEFEGVDRPPFIEVIPDRGTCKPKPPQPTAKAAATGCGCTAPGAMAADLTMALAALGVLLRRRRGCPGHRRNQARP